MSALVIAATAASLTACGPSDSPTVGERIDSTVARVEKSTAEAKVEIKQEMAEAKTSTVAASDKLASKLESASNKLSTTVQDVGITAGVNAELAKDAKLSALKIDVDTQQGAVALKGTAPDAAAKERAARLASAVKGVVSVDNQLKVPG